MTPSLLDNLPDDPSLFRRAATLKSRAGTVGFDWEDVHRLLDHAADELREIRDAVASGDKEAITDEMGDLLFVLANLARFTGTDAEDALRQATAKFERRFRHLENLMAARQLTPATADLGALWREAKIAT